MAEEVQDTRPSPPCWLDKNVIQTALREGDGDPTITVLSCDITMANAVGDGYTSDMYRVVAKLQDSNERRVIVKCQPLGGQREEMIKNLNAFETERKMLMEILPSMCKLLEGAKPGEYEPFSAKCLYFGEDPVQFLVLEDLRHSGFTLVEMAKGLDLTHCKLVVRTLARFHASSLALLEANPSILQNHRKTIYTEEFRKDVTPFYNNSMKSLEKTVLQWPGYEKYAEKIKNIRKNIYDRIMDTARAKYGELNTLVHGDCHSNNMMFRYSDTCVTDIRLVDFQTCYYSSPTLDLQYFLRVCPNEEVRRSGIDGLIKEYHSTFSDTLDILNCSAHKITLEKLKKEFDEHFIFGFAVVTSFLPLIFVDPSQRQDLDGITNPNDDLTNTVENIMVDGPFERIIKQFLVESENLGLL
ncbi:uncharacterized protein [Anabrus simplex]|uniref:uncharacterized protein n=1 Tax=Anabrus simplex TaxID=316456 RepID=UPI0035A346FB